MLTRLLLLMALAGLPCAAQFRYVKIWFEGTGCASCTESMPQRMRRLRGVESASVDGKDGVLEVHLVPANRVRVEQIRDLMEQDGTRTLRAFVRVRGELSRTEDRWVLQPKGVASSYELTGPAMSPGSHEISGSIEELHAGRLRIQRED